MLTVSVALSVAAMLGAAAAPAMAERATLGVANPLPKATGFECPAGCTVAQTALPNASAVTPPGSGRIVGWWALAKGPTVTARLRLFLPAPAGKFKAVGTSTPHVLSETVTEFPTSLPAVPGNLIGESATGAHGEGPETDPNGSANYNEFAADFADDTMQPFTHQNPAILQLGADFAYAPVVSGVAATSGSTAGGQAVVITGDHLTESTDVRFGSTPASSFTIDSNTQITAVAPAASPATVDVTVAGPGGTSATGGGDRYSFVTPLASVSPAALDFGSVPVGSATAPKAVTLTNTGSVPITVSSAALTGDGAADFTRFSDDCAGRNIPAGDSCSIATTFAPATPGPHRATLILDDTASDGPHNVVLVGTGTGTVAGAPSAPPPGQSAGPVSNAFSIGRLRGTRLPVTIASSGVVRVTEATATRARLSLAARKRKKPRLLGTSSASGGPGTVVVGLRLTGTARRTLKLKHRLKLTVRIAFTPIGGATATKTLKLVVKAKNSRR